MKSLSAGPPGIPGWQNTLYAARVLSHDGNRLFFESLDSLSLADTNGVVDVYQWEALGTGGCDESSAAFSAQNDGCISLVSSGKSPKPSTFVDASPSGDDVFFSTAESLVGQDTDNLVDIYDARVQGGLPGPTVPRAQCEGEACQPALEAPNDPTPASESFQGAGNVREETPAARHCPKGKVRRKGRCVAKRHRNTKQAKKHKRRSNHGGRAGR